LSKIINKKYKYYVGMYRDRFIEILKMLNIKKKHEKNDVKEDKFKKECIKRSIKKLFVKIKFKRWRKKYYCK
jgi:uncharacterized protein YueI